MVEDLILRYHLKDYQILMIGFVFGVYTEIFITGSIFGSGYFFGIDVFYFFLATIVWWGIIQGILTFYFANRYIAVRDWSEGKSGKIGWVLAFSFQLFMLLGFLFEKPSLPKSLMEIFTGFNSSKRTPLGYITSLIIFSFILSFYFIIQKIKTKKSFKEEITFERSKFLDVIVISSIIIGFILGTLLFGSTLAQLLFIFWSIIIGIAFIIYRMKIKKGVYV